MTTAIIQLVVGLFLLAEVCRRIFGWTYPTDFTYRICRPFGKILDFFSIKISMKTGVIITFAETVLGVILAYCGIMGLV